MLDNLTPQQIEALYETIHNPELFSLVYGKILVDDEETGGEKLIPFAWNDMQKDFNKRRGKRNLILKSRHQGCSTYGICECFRRCITGTHSAMLMAHDDTTTAYFRRMLDRFYQNIKFGNMQPARSIDNAGLSVFADFGSEFLIEKAGSVNVGHGTHITDFWGSEVSRWPDPEKIVVGALEGGDPDCTLESTPNGANGYFYELCDEALSGKSAWRMFFYPWWWQRKNRLSVAKFNLENENEPDEPFIFTEEETKLAKDHNLSLEQIVWRRNKQKILKRFFIEQHPEDPYTCFLTSGDGYFGNLDGVFTAPDGQEFNPDHRYRAGLDFAQSQDYTDLAIIDTTANCQCAYLHINQLSWEELRARIKFIYEAWRRKRCTKGHLSPVNVVKCKVCESTNLEIIGLKSIRAEANSIGSPNISALRNAGVVIDAFTTTHQSKDEQIEALYEAIHTGGLKLLNDPVMRQEFNSFVSIQLPSQTWVKRAAKGAHDDAVMATAFANNWVPPQIFLSPE